MRGKSTAEEAIEAAEELLIQLEASKASEAQLKKENAALRLSTEQLEHDVRQLAYALECSTSHADDLERIAARAETKAQSAIESELRERREVERLRKILDQTQEKLEKTTRQRDFAVRDAETMQAALDTVFANTEEKNKDGEWEELARMMSQLILNNNASCIPSPKCKSASVKRSDSSEISSETGVSVKKRKPRLKSSLSKDIETGSSFEKLQNNEINSVNLKFSENQVEKEDADIPLKSRSFVDENLRENRTELDSSRSDILSRAKEYAKSFKTETNGKDAKRTTSFTVKESPLETATSTKGNVRLKQQIPKMLRKLAPFEVGNSPIQSQVRRSSGKERVWCTRVGEAPNMEIGSSVLPPPCLLSVGSESVLVEVNNQQVPPGTPHYE